MQTRITKLLEIEYPVIQGGMAWVANAALAANVSKAGGIGFIGAANAPAEWVRGIPGRLPQRGHQLRQDLVHHRHARQALEDGHGRGQGHGLPSLAGSGRAGGGKGRHRFRAQGR